MALGDAASGKYRQVTGVAAGAADSDAVNVAQLKAVNSDMNVMNSQLTQQVQSLSNDLAESRWLAYSGVAVMAFAMSGTYLPTLGAGEKALGVGMGGYQG